MSTTLPDGKILQKIKNILINIAKKIEIVDMNSIPNEKTIDMLKNKNNETKKIVEFIKSHSHINHILLCPLFPFFLCPLLVLYKYHL